MITIVTAAFRDYYMDRVWESIKNQKYENWEWVIVNDGQVRIRRWYLEALKQNKFENHNVWMTDLYRGKGRFGLYARNIGAMAANGNYILFHDDDNQWEKDHMQSMYDLLVETKKIPYCWMHIKGKKPGSTHERIKKTGFHKQGIDLGCILWNKGLFDKYGYFKDDAQVTFDWNLIKRVYDGEGEDSFACTKNASLIFWHKRY